ncbi:MAG: peptide deformylase [Thiohalomonadales bacterium]
MTILDILHTPDERLKRTAAIVTDFNATLDQLVQDLHDTMQAGPGGVGIAAPQVGISKRLVIVDVSSKPKIKQHGLLVLVNPEIIAWQGFKIGREGCLSVPDFTGNVIRATSIVIQAQNPQGEKCEFECEGYEARAIQHEIDHLNGILFLDRLVSPRADLFPRQTK